MIHPEKLQGLPQIVNFDVLKAMGGYLSEQMNWQPVSLYCPNCGKLNNGQKSSDGRVRYECQKCKTVFIRTEKGRRHDIIDVFASLNQGEKKTGGIS